MSDSVPSGTRRNAISASFDQLCGDWPRFIDVVKRGFIFINVVLLALSGGLLIAMRGEVGDFGVLYFLLPPFVPPRPPAAPGPEWPQAQMAVGF